jgi:hypothetical protein
MESAFRAHPLWAGCSDEELESAGEVSYSTFTLYLHLFIGWLCYYDVLFMNISFLCVTVL